MAPPKDQSKVDRETLRARLWKKRWDTIQAYGAQTAEGVSEEQIDQWIHELRHSED